MSLSLLGTIALRKAVSCGHLEIIQVLIDAGVDVNALPEDTPLSQAILRKNPQENPENVLRKNLKMVKLLIAAGADVNKREEEGRTALIFAVFMDAFDIVKVLVEAGADVNMESYQGDIAICDAAAEGNLKIVNYLAPLSESKWRKIAEEDLREGIARRKIEKTIQEAADPLVTDLTDAVFDNDLKKVQQILAAGADVNGFDDMGTTALFFAVRKQSVELVQLLLEAGANPNKGNLDDGETPLMITHGSWHKSAVQICSLLLKAGADVNARDTKRGKTVLIHNLILLATYTKESCKANCRAIVQSLLQHGADLNAKDNDGNTALSIAKKSEHSELLKLLLDAGAIEG